jgi:hypothetical protein
MSIKSKLYAGFALLVLISVALTVYAITQFNGIKTNVATLNTLADSTGKVMEIERQLEAMRRATLRFAYDHDEGAAKETEQAAGKVDEMLREAAQSTPSEERRKLYNGLLSDLAATQKTTLTLFDTVKQMLAEQESSMRLATISPRRRRISSQKRGALETKQSSGSAIPFTSNCFRCGSLIGGRRRRSIRKGSRFWLAM